MKRTSSGAWTWKLPAESAGWCTVTTARAKRLCCARCMGIMPSRPADHQRGGIMPGVPLESIQTTHRLRGSASADLARAKHAGARGGGFRSIRQHRTQRTHHSHDRQHAERALRRFGIFGLRRRTLAELSYGQARRVLFARAWAREPKLALLDEPFAGLDRATRADLTRRLNDWIEAGGSCVIATHHRDEWPAHTTHVLELAAGRAVTCHRLGEA